MARPRKINDLELAILLAQGKTHEQAAKELGVARVTVTSRVKWLKENNPLALQLVSADEYRAMESDSIAQIRQGIIQELIRRIKTGSGLSKESMPQLAKTFGILFDKDRLIRGEATEHVAHIHKEDLDPETRDMIKQIINRETERALEESRKKLAGIEAREITGSGESDDETPTALPDYKEYEDYIK